MKRRDLLRSLLGQPAPQNPAQPPTEPPRAPIAPPDDAARSRALALADAQREQLAQGWGQAGPPGQRLDLQALLQRAAQAQSAPPPPPPKPLRPPGAAREEDFLAACTRCGDCLRACPHDALTPVRAGQAAGTPTLLLDLAPCHMCDPAPCIAACPTDALDAARPRAIGLASLKPARCAAPTGCAACAPHCPVPGALTFPAPGLPPHIDPDLCTGCGLCQHACTAPERAIVVLPRNEPPHEPRPDLSS